MKKLALLLALGLMLAACGASASGSEVATLEEATDTTEAEKVTADKLEQDAEESLLAFAQCMRDNGVPNFPDPNADGDGNFGFFRGGGPGDLGADRDTLRAAREQCFPLIEGVVQNFLDRDFSELEDTFLEFTNCMREKGIEIPDLDFSRGFGPGSDGEGGLFGDIDPRDPEFQAAAEECREVFEGQFGFGQGRFGRGG